jgi:hypothetical protein
VPLVFPNGISTLAEVLLYWAVVRLAGGFKNLTVYIEKPTVIATANASF